jgi:16S rRNA (guanine966-N2)-methyltransferase
MNTIRIIGGKYRSRHLELPKLDKTVRPTQDKVRQAIFSALGNTLNGGIVLDLFSGSGAYGFEAISRGADFVYFNDTNLTCVKAIKESGNKLECVNQIKVSNLNYSQYLKTLKNIKFDYVFLDPPYALEVNQEIIKYLLDNNLLSSSAKIIAEQEIELVPIQGFNLKTYKYSYKRVGIYTKEN